VSDKNVCKSTSCCIKTSVYLLSPKYSKTSWSSTLDESAFWKLEDWNVFSCLNEERAQLAGFADGA
jgi:hypothetical protein